MEYIYCAFCKHRRKAYTKKRMSFLDYIYVAVMSLLAMYIFFQSFHPGFFFIFFALVFVMEMFIQFRRRVSIQCNTCGFDPVLYVKSPKLAEERVRGVLNEKRESLDYLLKGNNPFENLKPKFKDESNQPVKRQPRL